MAKKGVNVVAMAGKAGKSEKALVVTFVDADGKALSGAAKSESVVDGGTRSVRKTEPSSLDSAVTNGAKVGELTFGSNGRKLDFLFNRNIDQSNAYNAARAEGNAIRIGIADTTAKRAEVTRLFNEALNNPASIFEAGKLPVSNVREFSCLVLLELDQRSSL